MSPQLQFTPAAEGKTPDTGQLTNGAVMGKPVNPEAMLAALENIGHQVDHGRIELTDTIVAASKADATGTLGASFTKVTPPAFMKPRGDEDVQYKYDLERNEDIGRVPFSLKQRPS